MKITNEIKKFKIDLVKAITLSKTFYIVNTLLLFFIKTRYLLTNLLYLYICVKRCLTIRMKKYILSSVFPLIYKLSLLPYSQYNLK